MQQEGPLIHIQQDLIVVLIIGHQYATKFNRNYFSGEESILNSRYGLVGR